MKSMTGYAYKEFSDNDITVSVEIKSYNSRFLDLSVYLPSWLSVLESGIREYLSSRFLRGKMDVGIKIKEHNSNINVTLNENAALTYAKAINNMAENLGIKEKAGLTMLLRMEGVVETEVKRDAGKYKTLIDPLLASAADQAETERIREGKHTEEHILSQLAVLEENANVVNGHVPVLEAAIKENIKTRFEELLGDKIDENRVLAETAMLLMKYTISEELSRLKAHLNEFRLEIARGESVGKKLDFLSQEINREINTIGSKTPVLEVSKAVVEMKNALENIREQLRNIE